MEKQSLKFTNRAKYCNSPFFLVWRECQRKKAMNLAKLSENCVMKVRSWRWYEEDIRGTLKSSFNFWASDIWKNTLWSYTRKILLVFFRCNFLRWKTIVKSISVCPCGHIKWRNFLGVFLSRSVEKEAPQKKAHTMKRAEDDLCEW